ncbi:hypothetical protein J6590_034136, partial [Homalodisca vitripennis]
HISEYRRLQQRNIYSCLETPGLLTPSFVSPPYHTATNCPLTTTSTRKPFVLKLTSKN